MKKSKVNTKQKKTLPTKKTKKSSVVTKPFKPDYEIVEAFRGTPPSSVVVIEEPLVAPSTSSTTAAPQPPPSQQQPQIKVPVAKWKLDDGKSVLFLSDLHLGVKDSKYSNVFQLDPAKFATYINNAIKRFDLIVLIGDVFELWVGTVGAEAIDHEIYGKRVKEIWESWEQTPMKKALKKLLNSPSTVLVAGNHDWGIFEYPVELPFSCRHVSGVQITAGSKKIFAAHGHQFDPQCDTEKSKFWEVSKAFMEIGGWISELTNTPMNDIQGLVSTVSTGDEKLTEGALKLIERDGLDLVLFGHTHVAMAKSTADGKRWYVNTGMCQTSPFDMVIVKFVGGQLKVSRNKVNL